MRNGEKTNPEEPFSFHDFKKWMLKNATNEFHIQSHKKGIGVEVEPKVGLKKLLNRMQAEEGSVLEMARDFRTNGGQIVEIDDPLVMVEVSSGTFIIPRTCIRRKD
jgi:hypothetical protein